MLKDDVDDATKQLIAREMNQADTAFVKALSQNEKAFAEDKAFELRWFTPTTEVVLCGHASVGAGAVLFYVAKNKNVRLPFVVYLRSVRFRIALS